MLSLLTALPALAATLAVLPLERGASGPELDGLGASLSGMIVSDLAGAPGLTLVERQRLDAVLSEIELGERGFLDPKTAQRLGKGSGAELVLVGSYSVVGDTLALDARLIEVESGAILDGATAQGALQDFVTVEKTLVEALLDELGATLDARARRDFYSRVPTESWDAFAAWSEGQAKVTAGDLEAARAAFQKALDADPDFQAAVEGLTALQSLIAQIRSRDTESRTTRYSATERTVLAKTVDARSRKSGSSWTPEDLSGLVLRWAVLLNQGQHCQRADEMAAYLDLVGWDPAAHAAAVFDRRSTRTTALRTATETLGYEPWDKSVHHPDRAVYEPLRAREAALWDSTHDFLFHDLSRLHDRTDVGLLTSLIACQPAAVRAKTLDVTWRKRLARHGQLDGAGGDSGLTNAEQLDVSLAWSEALEGAVSVESLGRLEALLARYPDEEEPRHRMLLGLLDDVQREADSVDRERAGRLGMERDVIRARLEAVESGRSPFRSTGGPAWCAPGRDESWAAEATRIRKEWDAEVADNDDAYHEVRWAARLVRVAGDMGCIQGAEARYTSFDDAAAQLRTARAHKHPIHGDESHCDSQLQALETLLGSGLHQTAPGLATSIAANSHLSLLQLRCLVETSP
jgi:TolB-like protein